MSQQIGIYLSNKTVVYEQVVLWPFEQDGQGEAQIQARVSFQSACFSSVFIVLVYCILFLVLI